jgi:hypothetical protein
MDPIKLYYERTRSEIWAEFRLDELQIEASVMRNYIGGRQLRTAMR